MRTIRSDKDKEPMCGASSLTSRRFEGLGVLCKCEMRTCDIWEMRCVLLKLSSMPS